MMRHLSIFYDLFPATPTTSTTTPKTLKASSTLPTSTTTTTRPPGVAATTTITDQTSYVSTTEQHDSIPPHTQEAVQNADKDLTVAVNQGMTLSTVHIAAAGAGGGGFILIIIVVILAVLIHQQLKKVSNGTTIMNH